MLKENFSKNSMRSKILSTYASNIWQMFFKKVAGPILEDSVALYNAEKDFQLTTALKDKSIQFNCSIGIFSFRHFTFLFNILEVEV